jgi:excisionase family DNA binding protein
MQESFMEINRPPLSIAETARRFGVSEQVIRNALRRGELDGFKIGKAWRITPESIDRKAGKAEAA